MAFYGPDSNVARILSDVKRDVCSSCYEPIDEEYQTESLQPLCPTCFAITYDTPPEGHILAGEQLPVAEVFTRREIKRLEFVRWMVSTGRLDDDIELR